MPEVTIKFNLPEEKEDYELAAKAIKLYVALWDTSQEVFRPARKHGYSDPEISKLLSELPDGKGEQLIALLEERFYRILEANDIDL